MKKIFLIIFNLNLFFNNLIFARDQDRIEHVIAGNLSLPTSQQPGPLFCFGQTVIDKGDFQGYLFGDAIWGKCNLSSDLLPYIIYGITDNLSLTAGIPFALKFKENSCRSSGIEDLYLQL